MINKISPPGSTAAFVGSFAINVWLVVRLNIWNWPVGIANVILLGLIFLDGGLYADAGLQVVYVVLQVWGWWQWLYGGRDRTELATQRTSGTEWAGLAVAGVAATALLTWLLSAWTDSGSARTSPAARYLPGALRGRAGRVAA